MSIDSRAIQYGKIFGDWSIRELIGQGTGGRNAVFKLARNKFAYEEISAMKVINIIEESGSYKELSTEYKAAYDNAREELWKKAEEEVRLMYNLRGNGNIVRYLDCDCADWVGEKSFGRDLLIRMDCLDNLRERMKQQMFCEKEIIKIGKDICNALTACHATKIWHRDIKPDNIFINQYDVYMLGDFGISKMVDECNSVETTAGTKAYAPPEQFIGKYDHRIDIYSLGLTLYELANGNKLPFAKTAYIRETEIRMRLDGKALPRINRVSNKLNDVIMRACEYDPNKRFQTAKDFSDALSAIEESEMFQNVDMTVTTKEVEGGAYETLLSSGGNDNYATELSAGEYNNYATELSSPEDKNYETIMSTAEGDNYETVKLPTEECNNEDAVLLTENDDFIEGEVNRGSETLPEINVEKPQLWYAKKSNDKIQVKIRRIDLEPKAKPQKNASSSLWYGKKK